MKSLKKTNNTILQPKITYAVITVTLISYIILYKSEMLKDIDSHITYRRQKHTGKYMKKLFSKIRYRKYTN